MRNERINTGEKWRGIIPKMNTLSTEKAAELATNKALTIYVGGEPKRVFLPYGFYYHRNEFSSYHCHSSYHEVIILIGDCELVAEDKTLKLFGTNMIMMPPKTFHKLLTIENVEACTFFIETDMDLTVKELPEELAREFFREAERVYKTNDYFIIAPFLGLIVSHFHFGEKPLSPEAVSDYAFLIDTFFNQRYMEDVSLEALAEHLHVSVTHAHRLIQRYMGTTFTEELTLRRLKVADYLVSSRGMSLTEAAEAVGFNSYSSFWKARTKYRNK